MKKNIGTIDRVLRIFFAVDIIILYYLETFTGILGAILLVIGGIFLVTSIFSSGVSVTQVYKINSVSATQLNLTYTVNGTEITAIYTATL